MSRYTLCGILLLATLLLLSGCGDDGPLARTRTVSGYASKGIIASGTVTAYKLDADGNKVLPKLAQTTTNTSGYYSMNIGVYFGAILVEVSGSYIDEATGQTAVIDPANPLMSATVPPVDATPVTLNVTGLTEIAYAQAKTLTGGLTKNIKAVNDLVSKCFLVENILTTRPMDASSAMPLSATEFQKQYTLVLAAVSQLAYGNLPAGTVTPSTQQLADALSKALTDLKNQLPADSTQSALALQTAIARAAMDFLDPANKNNHTGITQEDPSIQNVLAAARTVSGYASKGIIKNGTVTAYKIDSGGNRILPMLAQTTTDTTGFVTIQHPVL
jgi:spore maturation protein SpmB